MEWWSWLLLALAIAGVLAIVAYRLLRATHRGRAFLALSTRGKLRFGRALLGDRETPLLAKGLVIVLVAYLAMPFDLVPDFIPVLGQADDALIAVAVVTLLVLLVPKARFYAALAVAQAAEPVRDAKRPRRGPLRVFRRAK